MFSRIDRVNSLIRDEISIIIAREVKDPRIRMVTITSVETTKDLSLSKVFFSSVTEENKEELIKGLESASGFIRKCLKKNLVLKRIPQLAFVYDSSAEYGDKINNILKSLKDENAEK
ncbi:MAG: 30S ribosome-binding factor RbfA [Candidatus Schekmanbacteria bacterium]|nr:MAG: 30S ribosome-binding factor RbfA [Candidatus Schekmanbacteria bacterium]